MSKDIIEQIEENDVYGNKPVVLDIVISHIFAWDRVD